MPSPFVMVPYRDKNLSCVQVQGRGVFVDIQPICGWLGLDYNHHRSWLFDPKEAGWVECLTQIPGYTGACCLFSQKTVIGWLNGIRSGSISDPGKRAFLDSLKRECQDVLERYFRGETVARQQGQPVTVATTLQAMANALVDQEKQITEVRQIANSAGQTAQAVLASVGQTGGEMQIVGFLSMHGKKDLSRSEEACKDWGVALSALCRRKGQHVGKSYHKRYGEINSYSTDLLHDFFENKAGLSLARNENCLTCQMRSSGS